MFRWWVPISCLATNCTVLVSIGNFTTNLAESWMHIRSKFDGGKQINRSQAGSWNGCCAGAGLQCSEGAAWGPKCWEQALSVQPSYGFQDVSAAAKRKPERGKLQIMPNFNRKRLDTVQTTTPFPLYSR